LVRLEIKRSDNEQYVDVELGRDVFNQLNFKQGETVYLKPTQLRVF
jgi:sulfate/thiosulfate transport system ATP-binding protein